MNVRNMSKLIIIVLNVVSYKNLNISNNTVRIKNIIPLQFFLSILNFYRIGTQRLRLGEASQRQFDQCQLCLNNLIDPIATPAGYLYCRRCIIPNLLHQKQQNELLLEQYKQQEQNQSQTLQAQQQREEQAKIAAFEALERGNITLSSLSSSSSSSSSSTTASKTVEHHHEDISSLQAMVKDVNHIKGLRETKIDPRDKQTKYQDTKQTAFWISTYAPTAENKSLTKPVTLLVDPIANIPIKLKDLIKVNLHRIKPLGSDEQEYNTDDDEDTDENENTSDANNNTSSSSSSSNSTTISNNDNSKDPRFGCPSCLKGIIYQRTFLLKPCGHVFCDKCMLQFIAPNKSCATCTKPVTKTDILPLQIGGSSFAGHSGTQAMATKYNYSE